MTSIVFIVVTVAISFHNCSHCVQTVFQEQHTVISGTLDFLVKTIEQRKTKRHGDESAEIKDPIIQFFLEQTENSLQDEQVPVYQPVVSWAVW